jgi:class 3 adenylate cyclase
MIELLTETLEEFGPDEDVDAGLDHRLPGLDTERAGSRLERRNTSHREPWLGRIGIHSGPVVGSVVGVQRYVYDIFGPGVNLASRMETLAEPIEIAITEPTPELIREEFICSERGVEEVKGFGEQRVSTLDGELEAR